MSKTNELESFYEVLKAFDEVDLKELSAAEGLDMLHDNVLLKVKKPEEKIGSIVLPDISKERQKSGQVMRVGPGRRDSDGALIPMTVGERDIVFFPPHIFREIEHNGYKFLIVHEHEIIAKLRDGDEDGFH
jgi:chaperonin GroES